MYSTGFPVWRVLSDISTNRKMPPRILIADDNKAVRASVRALLAPHGQFEVCGEAAGGREAVDKTLELKPDLVILDIAMPDLGGLAAGQLIKQSLPETRIVFLSVHEDKQWIQTAALIGAAGYVMKTESAKVLVKAVVAVLQDQIFFPVLRQAC
jgi:DNA-binding NarL/FixJ family response regulator